MATETLTQTMTGEEMIALSKKHTLFEWSAQSKVDPIPVARAKGIYFWTPEGKRFIDFNSQLMCVNIGHGDERVVKAVQDQVATLAYANPFMATEPRARLGAKLAQIAPGDIDVFFFTNGGAEANENAIRSPRWPTRIRSWRRSRVRVSARSLRRLLPATSTCSSSPTAAPRRTRTRSGRHAGLRESVHGDGAACASRREACADCSRRHRRVLLHQRRRRGERERDQVATLAYANPFMATEPRARLGAKLAQIAPGDIDVFFFTNGGAEANENAIRSPRWPTRIRSWRRSRVRVSARSLRRLLPATSTCSSSPTAAPRRTRTR